MNPARDGARRPWSWLVVTDVDDTLLGDDLALLELERALRAHPEIALALNSSRPVASVRESLRTLESRPPILAIIGALGTEIEGSQPSEQLEDFEGARDSGCSGGSAGHDWRRHDWRPRFERWDASLVHRVLLELGHRPHDAEFQRPFKVSFAVHGTAAIEAARAALEKTGLELQTIASGESDFDVLPRNAGKGGAALWLAERIGLDPERLIVAGDSANDLDLFRVSARGIVVGNARIELRDAVDRSRAYLARASRAGGILEGLRHWGVLP